LTRAIAMNQDLQIVGFRIGREMFGVPISLVREVIRVPQITAVPDAPGYIEGVINLRGKIVPVIDLGKKLGISGEQQSQRANRIIVAEIGDRPVGLIVHSASEVLRISATEIQAPREVFTEAGMDYISGVGKLHGRLVILLDLQKIVPRTELRTVGQTPGTLVTVDAGHRSPSA
jgi:purine-binding chemotaxis protein CheW